MATARSLTSTRAIGGDDSESACGAGDSQNVRHCAADAKVAAEIEQEAANSPIRSQCNVTCPLDDLSLGDGIETEWAIREPPRHVRGRVEPPGRLRPSEPESARSSSGVGSRSRFSAARQSRERSSTLGSKAPPLRGPPPIAGREHLEQLARKPDRPSPGGLPAAELASCIVTAVDPCEPIDLVEHPRLGPSALSQIVGQNAQLQRGSQNILIKERVLLRGSSRQGGGKRAQEQEQRTSTSCAEGA